MSKYPYNTQAWLRLREVKFQQARLCEACLKVGRLTIATDVHHIKPIAEGGAAFPTLEGLMSLCLSCHSQVTKHGMKEFLVKGCDAFGNPLDPNHPWYKKSDKA
jgi:5-methylcytosine-specific restriction protein A